MATSKGFLVQLVWTTLICGEVLAVYAKPQQGPIYPSSKSNPVSPAKAQPEEAAERREFQEESPGIVFGNTKGFEIKHGHSFNLGNTPDGTPFSSGWTYFGGRAGPGPNYVSDDTGFLSKDVWSGSGVDTTTAVLYAGAAAVALSSLLYTFGPLLPSFSTTPTKSVKGKKKVTAPKVEVSAPATPSALEKEEKKGQESAPLKKEEEGTLAQETDDKKVSKSVKSRRKRASTPRNQAQSSSLFEGGDPDLTRLASIVLNAISSGECLQKTICQVGTQIGSSPKGRMAFSLMDTLLPEAVHSNQYFVTMKKALRGEQICDKFRCQYQSYE